MFSTNIFRVFHVFSISKLLSLSVLSVILFFKEFGSGSKIRPHHIFPCAVGIMFSISNTTHPHQIPFDRQILSKENNAIGTCRFQWNKPLKKDQPVRVTSWVIADFRIFNSSSLIRRKSFREILTGVRPSLIGPNLSCGTEPRAGVSFGNSSVPLLSWDLCLLWIIQVPWIQCIFQNAIWILIFHNMYFSTQKVKG